MTGRLALLPASVLIGDVDRQWISTAIPIVLQQNLATSEAFSAFLVPNPSAAYQAASTQVMRATVEERQGRFRIEATIASAETQQNTIVLQEEGPVSQGIIPLLNGLAKKLDPARAGRFSTHNESALKSFILAVSASDSATRSQCLEAAIHADPGFGLAQIARVENAPQPATLPPVPEDRFVPLDRARWQALSSRLHRQPLAEQAKAAAAVLQLAPNNVETLASLGTERFLQGNASEGQRLLQRAIELSPANGALPLQLAQGLVASGQFPAAAKVLAPLAAGNVNLLLSLALVQLLEGKTPEADRTFQRFISFLPANNPTTAAFAAQWQRFKTADSESLPPSETVEHWQAVVQQSGETDLAARAMLAAALERAGQTTQAQSLNPLPFLPEFTDPNAPVAFNTARRLYSQAKRR